VRKEKEKNMKAMKIGDELILRQTHFQIDRENDTADVVLHLEHLFGVSYAEEHRKAAKTFYFYFSKSSTPLGWNLIKDKSGSEIISVVAEKLKDALNLMGEKNKWEWSEHTKKYCIQEVIRNEGKTPEEKIWWEGEEGYEEAKERTKQEPEKLRLPWKKENQYSDLSQYLPLSDTEVLYNHLVLIKQLKTFGEVIDI